MTLSKFTADDHGQDTFAWLSEPDRTHGNITYAILQNNAAYYYVYWPGVAGIPKDASIQSARLYIYTAGDWTGSVTLGAVLIADSWTAATLTWNNRPGVSGAVATVTHSPTGEGFEYELNLDTQIGNAITNGDFKGIRVGQTVDGDAVRIWQRESNSPTTVKARLEIVWTAAGQKPSRLQPNGIVGLDKPLLTGFPRDTQAVRVWADPDEDGFGAPAWSSGTQDVDGPEYDLATSTFPGTAEGDSWWWEVATQDANGNWSDTSDPVEFTYIPLPTLTMLNPSADNPVVTDASFPVVWDVSDQKSFRVYVTLTDGKGTVVYDSGKIMDPDDTTRAWTIPGKDSKGNRIIKLHDIGAYRVWLESFPSDTLDRVPMPGALQYSRAAQVFTLISVPGVPPMSSIYVTQDDQSPTLGVHCTRDAGAPDQLNLWRDGELIDTFDPEDVLQFDEYVLHDTTAAPNTEHNWYVQAVVNGNASVPGPHAVFTPVLYGFWFTDFDRDLAVCVGNHPDGSPLIQSMAATDQATVTQALSAEFPDTDTTAIGRLQFIVHGVLHDDPPPGNRSASSYERDLYVMKGTPAQPVMAHYQNKAFPVTIANIAPTPYDNSEDTDFSWQVVDITVRQVGPWIIYPDNTDNGGVSDPLVPDIIYRYADEGLGDGDPLTVGSFDITAVAGTPAGADDAIVPGHTDTEGWS